jgi:hypothetical protein
VYTLAVVPARAKLKGLAGTTTDLRQTRVIALGKGKGKEGKERHEGRERK